jgi:hypothetical protein
MRKCLSDDLGRFAEVGELQAAQKPHFVSAHRLCRSVFMQPLTKEFHVHGAASGFALIETNSKS